MNDRGPRPIDAVRAEVDQLAAAIVDIQQLLARMLLATICLAIVTGALLWRR